MGIQDIYRRGGLIGADLRNPDCYRVMIPLNGPRYLNGAILLAFYEEANSIGIRLFCTRAMGAGPAEIAVVAEDIRVNVGGGFRRATSVV